MSNLRESAYITRDDILKMLSDDEVAHVSTAETSERLEEGAEYLDLEHLELGVRKAPAPGTPMGRVLPREAVQGATWDKILKHLPANGSAGAVAGA